MLRDMRLKGSNSCMAMVAYVGIAFVLRTGKTVFYCFRSHHRQK